MPVGQQISNVGGVYGQTAGANSQLIGWFVNNSGGTLVEGDVVVCTDVAGINVTSTTTALSVDVVGVIGPPQAVGGVIGAASNTTTYAAGAVVPVVLMGAARINIGALTVAANAGLQTSTTAKAVDDAAAAVGGIGSTVGVSKESQAAKDANNTIRAFIKNA